MKRTIYLLNDENDKKFRRFESIEYALKMNPIIIVEEVIEENGKYSYSLYNSNGDITDIIELGAWKFKITGILNTNHYPYIYFDLIDPYGEINSYEIGDKAIWAFEKAISILREAKEFVNYKTFHVFEENKRLNKQIEKLELKINELSSKEI